VNAPTFLLERGDQALKREATPDHNVKGTHIMANSNSTQPQSNDRTIGFAAPASPFYRLHEDVTPGDIHDQLEARLSQLDAMLTMTTGAGFESFSNWSNEIKENYLWACSMLAAECKELITQV
jgi:hypothetical protein